MGYLRLMLSMHINHSLINCYFRTNYLLIKEITVIYKSIFLYQKMIDICIRPAKFFLALLRLLDNFQTGQCSAQC